MELPDKTATQLAAENPAPGRSGVVEVVKEASCPSSDDKGTVSPKMTLHEMGGPKEIQISELFVFGYSRLVFESYGY